MVAMIFGLLMLASCLPVPLGDPEKSQIESKLSGFWIESADANSGNIYIIAPFDSHCYVVQAVQFTKKEDRFETKSSAWRAWLTDIKGTRFITLQSVAHMADPKYPGDKFYPIAKIEIAPDMLTTKALDANYPKFNGVKDSGKLAEIVQANLDDPKMYVEPATVLRRMDANNEADANLMKLAVP
jgi:hypothetical protein